MATCGTCQRDVIWATDAEGEAIALDKVATYDGERFTLQHPEGGGRPNAVPIIRPGYFAGYRKHSDTCGKGTPS